ncbi:MAG: hypothetical protein M3378_03770, partial [Actinomycetota bacterium]|nr:hypothetical protein [Actinomycetota bacterium]
MAEAKRSIWQRLYHGETQFDFVGKKRRGFAISAAVILLGLGSLFTRGLNFGIDFEGGTVWEVPAPGVSVAEGRDALRPVGLGEAKVQVLQPPRGSEVLRVQAELGSPEDRDRRTGRVTEALARLAQVPEEQVNVNSVGPSWGSDVTAKAQRALIFFFLAIALYITWRFEWKM